MNKKFIIGFALLALTGILGFAVLANANQCLDNCAAEQSADTACHFTCHTSHHQWTPAAITETVSHLFKSEILAPDFASTIPDPPLGAIFHPPQIL